MIPPRLLDNRYKVVRSLADGGFGTTFLAVDTRLPSNRQCVVKQLKLDAQDPTVQALAKDRFNREAVVLEALGHRHQQIPQLYAYFEEAGQFYLVQEYVEGDTLTQRVQRQGRWRATAVQTLLGQLLPVLAYVHDKGIIHRDIKPDNIILRQSDDLPVLIDFGAVKEALKTNVAAPGQPQPSVVIGTSGFMPPEQATGHPTFSSDLYALGLTAIYALTGQLPQAIAANPMTGEIDWQPLASDLPPRLAAVLSQVIRPIPRDRFASATAMMRALSLAPPAAASSPRLPRLPEPPENGTRPGPESGTAAKPAATYTEANPTRVVNPAAAQTAAVASPPEAPAAPVKSANRGGCRWLLWGTLIVAIALASGVTSFVLKRRSIVFFSRDSVAVLTIETDLTPAVARSTIEAFYEHVSNQSMDQARALVGGTLAEQLDPNSTFFQQFDRVSVENLAVTAETGNRLELLGNNTYYYPDGSTQEEERTFTVQLIDGQPLIVASKFVRVIKAR
ncbi:MAG: serine/threonine-protein kinase [Cyanobacteria bacterium J06554_6]